MGRAFTFNSLHYNFPSRWNVDDWHDAKNILKQGIVGKWSSNEIYRSMVDNRLGYNRQDMLKDISRARAIEFGSDYEKRDKAENWYTTVLALRDELGLRTTKEATQVMLKWQRQSDLSLEEAEAVLLLEERDYYIPQWQ